MVKKVKRNSWLSLIWAVTTCALIFIVGSASAKTIHVGIDGKSGNDGSSFSKGYDFNTALGKVTAGDTILVQGGTHSIPYVKLKENTIDITVNGSNGKPICIIAEKNKRAIFDFSHPDNCRLLDNVDKQSSKLRSYGFDITGSYLYFNGVDITRAGYQGAYVKGANITFENCRFFKNWNSGVEVNDGGSYVTFLNCDSYSNNDGKYKDGGMADGFAIKQKMGAGNKAIGCRAWGNSDDGYDTYDSDKPVIFENCWAMENGLDLGNGNGFKVGGSPNKDVGQKNILKNCVAFGNVSKGFDQNSNTAGITVYNCTSYKNGNNYGFGGKVTSGKHVFKNNIAIDGKVDVQNATESNNTWSSGFSVSSSDFESLDLSLAKIERNLDGTLPDTKLFRLKKGSKLIDAGVEVGIKTPDGKPDLGAFEYKATTDVKMNKTNVKSSIGFTQSLQMNKLIISLDNKVKNAIVNVYTLSGIKVLGAIVNNQKDVSLDCSLLVSGGYVTELDVNGVKKQMKFMK